MKCEPFINRIQKRLRTLRGKARQQKVEAFRVYDKDIPQFPYIVDCYRDHVVVYEKKTVDLPSDPSVREIELAVAEAFGVDLGSVHFKTRQRMAASSQYEASDVSPCVLTIGECGAQYEVELSQYLDTGLFLDHRPMRKKLLSGEFPVSGKRFLNLFCYTGAVSVAAALGGAQCTNIDLSKTYLAWASRNVSLNGLDPKQHDFIHRDVLQWLAEYGGPPFDFIFLDPPSFSNSKRMLTTLDIQRDHLKLIKDVMRHLSSDGVLWFSNNKRRFSLDDVLRDEYSVEDMTRQTIGFDFIEKKPHVCFEIKKKRAP